MSLMRHVLDNFHIRVDLYELLLPLQHLLLFLVLDLFMLLKLFLAGGNPLIVQFFIRLKRLLDLLLLRLRNRWPLHLLVLNLKKDHGCRRLRGVLLLLWLCLGS